MPALCFAVLTSRNGLVVSRDIAAPVGIIPALFGGWFVARFVLLNARTADVETRRHKVALHEIDEIIVTGTHAGIAATITEESAKAA